MDRKEQFEKLAREFNLKAADFYFLDLIPLIEVMWLDGKNQQSELRQLAINNPPTLLVFLFVFCVVEIVT
ncbi:hypothetical protein [Methyloprofundus sp.]|uniref:hypothetical protein n=1 Tax=Methyloprofundus sp. TaxID=2020875 RepID=UPI003D0AAB09